MTIVQKVEALNKACEDSLGFQCYTMGWEVSSFRDGTPLHIGRQYPKIKAKTFNEAVDAAYKFVFQNDKKN